jgi:hypothetical protein
VWAVVLPQNDGFTMRRQQGLVVMLGLCRECYCERHLESHALIKLQVVPTARRRLADGNTAERETHRLPRSRALGEVKPLRPALVDVLQVTMEKMTVQVSRVCDRSVSSPSTLARLALI